MATYQINNQCRKCMGTGLYTEMVEDVPTEVPCNACNGEGFTSMTTIDEKLHDDIALIKRRLKKILDKLEISENE